MKCKYICTLLTVLLLCLTACDPQTPVFVDLSVERSCAEPTWTGKTYTWDSLIEQATYIVEADVTGTQRDADEQELTLLTVCSSLKGDLKGEILVRDTVWLDGATERSLCGEPMMREGHRVVLFLERTDTVSSDGRDVYAPVDGAAVAKFFYDADGAYHNALSYSAVYRTDIENKGGTQMPVLDDMTPKTLTQLRSLIKG